MTTRRAKKLLKELTVDYLSKIEKQAGEKKSLNVTFPQYVGLVRNFTSSFLGIKRSKGESAVIFTALCITPWQWFNYNLRPVSPKKAIEVGSLSEVETMEIDSYWADYHKYLIRLKCAKGDTCDRPISKCITDEDKCFQKRARLKFYRYILTVDPTAIAPEIIPDEYFFPSNDVVQKQLMSHYVLFCNESETLTIKLDDSSYSDLAQILRDKNPAVADLYMGRDAYILIDKTTRHDLANWMRKSNKYKAVLAKDAFAEWFLPDSLPEYAGSNYVIEKDTISFITRNHIPQDFILFGVMDRQKQLTWQYCLASDITADAKMAQLSVLFGEDQNRLLTIIDLLSDHLKIMK